MDIGDYQLVMEVEDTNRRRRRKRNDAFRRRLQEEKAAKKEDFRMRLTSVMAIVAWIFAAIQYFR